MIKAAKAPMIQRMRLRRAQYLSLAGKGPVSVVAVAEVGVVTTPVAVETGGVEVVEVGVGGKVVVVEEEDGVVVVVVIVLLVVVVVVVGDDGVVVVVVGLVVVGLVGVRVGTVTGLLVTGVPVVVVVGVVVVVVGVVVGVPVLIGCHWAYRVRSLSISQGVKACLSL